MKHGRLVTWIGNTDLRASRGELVSGEGPIAQAVEKINFSEIVLLSDHSSADEKTFFRWLRQKTSAEVRLHHCDLQSPTDYESICREVIKVLRIESVEGVGLTYHLSPGTPAMAAVWILLSKTSHPAKLIESSLEAGVRTVSIPFEISADYLPSLLEQPEEDLLKISQGLPPETPEFEQIVHRCKPMKKVIAQARIVSGFDLPVLLQGESGTGKELLARAIHSSSSRQQGPFVAVNCGAIPDELLESELFGHVKGAFTGAVSTRKGYLEEANSGTLFLDEIGDLPIRAQVKILRVLQDGELYRVGSSQSKKVDFRLIAATNKFLIREVSEGRFREDLFHRIAVAVMEIPPLRERRGDLNLLIDFCLSVINETAHKQPGWQDKKLSAGARNLLHQHPWPGNIRELINTLSRAAIWSAGADISTDTMRGALFPLMPGIGGRENILNRNLGNGLDIQQLLTEVAQHYLGRAMREAHGNKSEAAKLIGLPSYQTLTNWLKKYDVS